MPCLVISGRDISALRRWRPSWKPMGCGSGGWLTPVPPDSAVNARPADTRFAMDRAGIRIHWSGERERSLSLRQTILAPRCSAMPSRSCWRWGRRSSVLGSPEKIYPMANASWISRAIRQQARTGRPFNTEVGWSPLYRGGGRSAGVFIAFTDHCVESQARTLRRAKEAAGRRTGQSAFWRI